MAATNDKYRVIGTRPVRPDGVDKVTGRAVYGADVQLPRMAYGKIIRSPYAHARIVSIDTSQAEALPGVLAVLTDGPCRMCCQPSLSRTASPRVAAVLETPSRKAPS